MSYRLYKVSKSVKSGLFKLLMFITKPIRIYTSTELYEKRAKHKYKVKEVKKLIKNVYRFFDEFKSLSVCHVSSYSDFEWELQLDISGRYIIEEDNYRKMFEDKMYKSGFLVKEVTIDEYREEITKLYRNGFSETQFDEFNRVDIGNAIILKVERRIK